MYFRSRIGVCIIVAISVFSAFAESPAPTPIIAQYFGIFLNQHQTWNQKLRSDTPLTKINRIYISFGKIVDNNNHFSLAFDGSASNAVSLIQQVKQVNPHAQIFLTVGGNNDVDSYGGAAMDPQFATKVLQFLDEYGFDGFDIDWEDDIDQKNLDLLVTHLAAVLHHNNDLLTLVVWPYPVLGYDMPVLKNNLDDINIMSYGTGISLPLTALEFLRSGFPLNKMIGGIDTENGFSQFGGVTDTLGAHGSIAQKANYALSSGMAGMMEWHLDSDYATNNNPNYPTYQGALQLWNSMTSTNNNTASRR